MLTLAANSASRDGMGGYLGPSLIGEEGMLGQMMSPPFLSVLPTVSKGKCKRRRLAFGEKETIQVHFLRASPPIPMRLVFLVPASYSSSILLPYEAQNVPRMEECGTYS